MQRRRKGDKRSKPWQDKHFTEEAFYKQVRDSAVRNHLAKQKKRRKWARERAAEMVVLPDILADEKVL